MPLPVTADSALYFSRETTAIVTTFTTYPIYKWVMSITADLPITSAATAFAPMHEPKSEPVITHDPTKTTVDESYELQTGALVTSSSTHSHAIPVDSISEYVDALVHRIRLAAPLHRLSTKTLFEHEPE